MQVQAKARHPQTEPLLAEAGRLASSHPSSARAPSLRFGGRLVEYFFAQGDYDVVGIAEFPDAEAANASALAIIGAGHVKAYKTTPLFTVEETMRTLRRAGEVTYRAPGG